LAALAVLAAMILPLALPGVALAHERRLVAGRYQFVVGFLNEPVFAGQMSGIDLRVTIPAEDNRPVEGLERMLRATVIVGGGAQSLSVELRPRFGQPGAYAGYFLPTRAGSYIFQFTGTIDGTPINERFESGPGRFDDVQAVEPLQFPVKLPDPGTAANEIKAARAEAAAARTLALVGLVVGIAGLLTGGASLAARRRPEGAAARQPVEP